MPVRPLFLVLAAALLVSPALHVARGQGVEPLTVQGIERDGDELRITLRANVRLEDIVLRLTDGSAVVGLPDWQRSVWRSGEVSTGTFTLLRDVDVATLEWQAAESEEGELTGSIPLTVPPRSFVEDLTLTDIRRAGDDVLVTLRANTDIESAILRLTTGGAIVGLPEWQETNWSAGDEESWTFRLLRATSTATIDWEIQPESGARRAGSIDVQVPDEPTDAGGEAAPRLVVTSAVLRGTLATVNVTNHGTATARGVVVAIEDAAAKRVGTPLTRVLSVVAPGAQASAEFTLPEGLVDVVVALEQQNETTRTALRLRTANETGAASGVVNATLSTDLPFREVDVGRSADYAVQVRNEGAPALVQLRVDGLPQGYSARFFVGGSAVPSLYLDHNQTRQVTLTITVPNAREEVDRTVDFSIVAVVNGTEADRLAMGVAVRGVGVLEVSSPDGEAGIGAGGQATFQVVVRNTGSAPVFNVQLETRRPYGWTVRAEPTRLDRIDPGGTSAMSVEVRAPDVIGGGRYSVDVAAKAEESTSRFVSLGVRVDEPEQGGGWIWVALLVAMGGILAAAAWWKRRG